MKCLHELLADAVPELPEVDRLAEVGRRVRRRRRARGVVASGVVVALTAGALVGAQWFGSVREDPVATPPPVVTKPVLECPPRVQERPFPRPELADGPVADESAVNALLCVYDGMYGGGPVTVTPIGIEHDVANVVRAMNALAPMTVDQMRNIGCRLPATPEYQIVLGYPDGRQQLVRMDPKCSVLYHDTAIRYGDARRPLEEFSAIVRADGRESPYLSGSW
ncbi:hypothetical protein AB0425_21815 [Actinosynnema sp. NPDC051121]